EPVALVLARKIRLVAAARAREETALAAAAFRSRDARTIYYKYSALFDSTSKGNIGPIAETLLTETGAARTLFCPAYIDRTVTIYQGLLFVGRTPLAESFKRHDPVTPAQTSDLVAKLSPQTHFKVGLINHQALRLELGALRALIESQDENRFLIADAVDDADVSKLAALTRDWKVVTGADSLAPAIMAERRQGLDRQAESGRRLLPPAPGHEALLVGSCAEATRAQLRVFEAHHPTWHVDLARDAANPRLADDIVAWAQQRLKDGPIAVSTNSAPDRVRAAQDLFGVEGASQRADQLLGKVAMELQELGVSKYVIAGGETSGEILNALGVKRLQVAAYDDELFGGYCHHRDGHPMSFVLKPGSMGHEDFFARAFARMREADSVTRSDNGTT
ncbi:MAG TPA: four-carbon acid sugar kinase family protein, partial [Steroidobacteraceae bacterium]